ncbi:MAG TPA: glycosyltransferase family 9 protein [Gemmatimonadaceae bacterium]|nr:glycosyltransferase family 9 protein [Gemmatimonadaceae bacterium]
MSSVKLDRVLIVMMSAIGDAVHTLPVVNAIKRHHPRAHLTWILQPGPAEFVRGHPGVDEIIVFQRAKKLRGFLEIFPELRKRRYDVVINLQVYLKGGIMTLFSRAPVKVGFDRSRARDLNWLFTSHRIPKHAQQHVQDQYLEFLDWLEIPSQPLEWNVGPWDSERAWQREFMSQFDRPIAPIIIATSKPGKDWMADRWATVCNHLYTDFGLQPILVGGRSPRELAAEQVITAQAKVPVVSALGSGLRKLVSILDAGAVTLSPDTGPLHMAVAMNKPVISLMGSTNPKRVGPYRRFHDLMIDRYGDPGEDYPIAMVFRKGRMERITVEDVLGKLQIWKSKY